MIKVDPVSFVPFYEQVKQQIKSQIIRGRWKPRAPLPSIRDLATQLIINPNTVARAYRDLEVEGFIYAQKGKGCYVSAGTKELVQKEKQSILEHVFDEAINEARKFDLGYKEIEILLRERVRAAESQHRGG